MLAGIIVAVSLLLTRAASTSLQDAGSEFLRARELAQDRAAQSDLRNALAAAKVYFTDDDSYLGFDAATGQTIEPTLVWVDGEGAPPGDDAVGISPAGRSSGTVVLNADSESGRSFCIADHTLLSATVRGVGPAASFEECAALPQW